MEIIVEGLGNDYFTPDQVILGFNFYRKGYSYDEVLEKGVNDVQIFINDILLKYNFDKEDLKTRSFRIEEKTKYNEITRNYDKDGFMYNQSAILKFDYNKDLLANILVDISKLVNPPQCRVNFSVKDEKDCRKKILAKAYKDAENKASAIADAAGLELKRCEKVDFKPFTNEYTSSFSYGMDYNIGAAPKEAAAIANSFTPEDIELEEKLYCLWIAE